MVDARDRAPAQGRRGLCRARARAARPTAGNLRTRQDGRPLSAWDVVAVSLSFLGNEAFWINVGVLATTYGVFSLGIQLNVGTTGIINFGQAGFMAVGSYAMGILVVKSGVSFWAAMLLGILVAIAAALLVGLPSLRLRSDYFAIATLAFSEIIRYGADNWDGLTGGNLGLFGYTDEWTSASARIDGWLARLGIDPTFLLPLLVVNLAVFTVLALLLALMVRSPWGRVLNAIREDEDAARALGKNTFAYKLQSLALSASLAAVAGYMLAINISILSPQTFDPVLTAYGYVIVILAGLGSYLGVAAGSLLFIFVLEATRYLELPLSDARVAALRFMIVGAVLMALVVLRPQGLFGKREELTLRAR